MFALLCAAVAGAIAFAIGRAATPIGTALGLLDFPDDPGGRKRHAGITPLVGGLAVTVVVVLAVAAITARRSGATLSGWPSPSPRCSSSGSPTTASS